MLDNFTERLTHCQERADMTVSDLARWFSRPRATVNTWLLGRYPTGPAGRLAIATLLELERELKRRRYEPIPANLTGKARAGYIRGMRNDAVRNSLVPRARAAG